MANQPDDLIDPYEPRLTRRVGAFAEQAVRPIDPTAIAATAVAGARRRTLAGRLFGSASSAARLGVVLAGAVVAAAVLGALSFGGPRPTATSAVNDPLATPTSVPGSVEACASAAIGAEITAWEGAAGHRIASLQVTNIGAEPCTVAQYFRPALVDEDGHALIVSNALPEPAPITMAAGSRATTLVDMANYCGTEPSAPLFLRLYLPSDEAIEAHPATSVRLPIDPPPCNGPNAPSTIDMQPLQLGGSN